MSHLLDPHILEGMGYFPDEKKKQTWNENSIFVGELFLLELQQKTGNIRSVVSLKNLFALSYLLK